MMCRNKADSRSGFTLIEVALSVLVVAVGLLSIMALLPVGLDASRKAADDTRKAMFAEEVMSALYAVSQQHPWATFPVLGDTPERGLPPPFLDAGWWDDPASLIVKPNVGMQTIVYRFASGNFKDVKIVDYALRYDLAIQEHAGNTNLYDVRLEVWNGEFGAMDESTVFYAEIYNNGVE